MKKLYKAPVCETIEIEMQDIIASSPELSTSGYSDTSEEGLAKERFLEFIDSEDTDNNLW
ncbi:MAG: hypothetical protein KBT29_05180 [Prevotellaceae bacterium]|nr:hypothetical protein [Candidatus Minthosoma caballi]